VAAGEKILKQTSKRSQSIQLCRLEASRNIKQSSATPRPAQAPTPRRRTPTPRPTPRRPTNTPLPRLLFNNLLLLGCPLFLPLPMASLLVVLADPQRPPEPLALLNLGFRQLVDLVALEASGAGSAAVARLLGGEFLAQGVALVVDRVFVHAVRKIELLACFLPRWKRSADPAQLKSPRQSSSLEETQNQKSQEED
jgi:hypothetical protein